jgi:hypothetical protein
MCRGILRNKPLNLREIQLPWLWKDTQRSGKSEEVRSGAVPQGTTRSRVLREARSHNNQTRQRKTDLARPSCGDGGKYPCCHHVVCKLKGKIP